MLTYLGCNDEEAYGECDRHASYGEPQMGEKHIDKDEVVDGNWKNVLLILLKGS